MVKQSPLIPKLLTILAYHGFQWSGGAAPADLEIRRIRVGAGYRSSGAWSWALWSVEKTAEAMDIGSQWPATEVVRWGPTGAVLQTNQWGQTAICPTDATLAARQQPKHKRPLPCPRCGARKTLTLARSVPNGGTLKADSLWQGQRICGDCIQREGP